MTDGIGDLLKRKEAAKRPTPTPRHPVDRTKQPANVRTPRSAPNAEPAPPAPIDSRRPPACKLTHDADGGRVKPAQFQIDQATEDHLAALQDAGKAAGLGLNNSLLVRRAITLVVDEHGYDGFVAWVAQSQRRKPGRPRLD